MQLTIEKLVHGGSGVGTFEGKKIFVPFTAPGDVVEVRISKDHGHFAEAELVRVVEASRERVSPRCPVFGRCGGCQWQHLSCAAQLTWKRAIVVESLNRIGKLELQRAENLVLPTQGSPKEWNYRNRIQLHVRDKKVGFYAAKTNDVVEFERCFIAHEKLNEELHAKRAEISQRDRGIQLRLDERTFFTQVNTEQNAFMRGELMNWVKTLPHHKVLELYAGGGNFTFPLAEAAEEVIACDLDVQAINLAKNRQKELDPMQKIQFEAISSEKLVKKLQKQRISVDGVVLDPPRKGASEVLPPLVALKPQWMIYISCDPATFSRDIKWLALAGYHLTKVQPLDMFPQTFHVEVMGLLQKQLV